MSRKVYGRSAEASEYQRWYGLKRWKERRKAQLTEHPFCLMCEGHGVTSLATVADHVIPHRGDPDLFWFGALCSLDAYCHSVFKQQIERRGYSDMTDAYGWPSDPQHPANRR